MFVAKVIKCKIFSPTKKKYNLLNQEYQNLQEFLQLSEVFWWDKGIDKVFGLKVYSANKQQALRFYKKIKPKKEYPLHIRNDIIDIQDSDNKFAKYWVRIRIAGQRGGICLPIRTYHNFPKEYKIRESIITKKGKDFYIHITIQKEVTIKKSYSSVLPIDLGEKVIATTVLSVDKRPTFYGREVRGIRRKYAYIRKKLGEKKLLKKIKQLGQKEQRTVNQILHEISKSIVTLATNSGSLIVLGDLKGIRKNVKGRRFNRIVSNMPYYKLTQMIIYKANWEGIQVVKIDERGTSQTCPKCGNKGTRPYQGLFKCPFCGYQANADFVGTQNILNRSLEYISEDGAVVTQPKTLRCKI